MSKLGLVFAGGGGKGAYEIGVWKALKEYGIDKSITAISGTSVGGLNGALFTKGDIEQAVKVWEEMNPEKILQIDIESISTFIGKILPQTRVATFVGEKLGFLKSQGIFEQKGLETIIRDSLKEDDLKDKIPFYICATDVSSRIDFKPIYKKLNDLDYEEIVQYLLATSAIPIAFPKNKVNEKELVDGFLTDNTPIKPLIENEKCDKVIVVLLGRSENTIEQKAKYPNVNFWEIVPTQDTKENLGSLDFKSETAKSLILMGYQDTIKILQNLYEFMLVEKNYIQKGEVLRVQNNGFKKQISNNSLLRTEYKQLEDDFKDINSLQYLLNNSNGNKKDLSLKTKNQLSIQDMSKELELTLDEIDCELIDRELDRVLDKMNDNSSETIQFAFESITSLASNTGRINYQASQGLFSRFMGSVTGKDHKLQADINLNFSQSIYANTQLIKKLSERNNLSLDMCIFLGNKVNFLANNQNQLQLQNNQHLKMMINLRNSIFTLANITKTAIEDNTRRIEKLEYSTELLNWSHQLKSSIHGLNCYEGIMKTVSSYFDIIQDSDNQSTTEFFHSALINSGYNSITINPTAFLEYVIDNDIQIQNVNFLPIPKSYEPFVPVFSSLANIYEKNKLTSLNEVITNLEKNYDINLDIEMSGVEFAFELFNGFKISKKIKMSLDKSKTNMVNKLEAMKKILLEDNINAFDETIIDLLQQINDFKVVVPVIGKFSSGKSKLLNSYITNKDKLFEVDTNPTTALPCEIKYGEKNIVMIHDKNNNINEISIKEVSAQELENIKYLEYCLNYKKLKHRNDLIIVDMPGFESSNLHHNNAINQYFNKGNHYILALNCETANDDSILKNIKEILSYGAKFSIVITKTDKKLPKEIDEIVRVVEQNILRKYPDEKFFVGVTSSFKNQLNDFEKIIDDIYEKSPMIFESKFKKALEILINDLLKYYSRLLNTPNNTIEFEKEAIHDKKRFNEEVSKLNLKLKDIKSEIEVVGYDTLLSKVESVLNANISMLSNSAKNNSLPISITELLRAPLNNIFQTITTNCLQQIENEAINISNDLNISFSNVHIDTKMSLFDIIKNFFFNTKDKEIRDELKNNIIPTILRDMSINLKEELKLLYTNIENIVNKKIVEKENIVNNLSNEIKKKISLKTNEYETLQNKLSDSIKKIKKVQYVIAR